MKSEGGKYMNGKQFFSFTIQLFISIFLIYGLILYTKSIMVQDKLTLTSYITGFILFFFLSLQYSRSVLYLNEYIQTSHESIGRVVQLLVIGVIIFLKTISYFHVIHFLKLNQEIRFINIIQVFLLLI